MERRETYEIVKVPFVLHFATYERQKRLESLCYEKAPQRENILRKVAARDGKRGMKMPAERGDFVKLL